MEKRSRSRNLRDVPNARAWLNNHPKSARNLSRVLRMMSRAYVGENEGYINRNADWVEYLYAPKDGDQRIRNVHVAARRGAITVRFYLYKAYKPGGLRSKILKSAEGLDLHAIDFKIGNADSLGDLEHFISATDTFAGGRTPMDRPRAREISEQITKYEGEEPPFDPTDARDGRKRILREVVHRRGQPAFRKKLIRRYEARCVITDCDVEEVLEAAHITPYKGEHTNAVQNGLLLRADVHTLWDLGLIAIDPKTFQVWVADEIRKGPYAVLANRKVKSLIVGHALSALTEHWKWVLG